MKIKLSVNDKPMNGYISLDPVPADPSIQPAFSGSFADLTAVVNMAECTEILADDILDYIHISDMYNVVQHWCGLLRHGGKIIIGGTDIAEVAKAIAIKAIDNKQANLILHGSRVRKASQISMDDLVSLLKSFDLKITKKRLNGMKMVVEAVRQ